MTTAGSGHVVLAEPTVQRSPRSAAGRPRGRSGTRWANACASRYRGPRSATGAHRPIAPIWSSRSGESHQGRVDSLIPVRVGRMTASPYGFLRGTAIVMAQDVAGLPATGITPVICGDSHLGNFGFYASPERDLVIDLNDFDEAHPGGWEWDLRRLVASIWVAGRQNGGTEEQCETAVASCVAAYRDEVRLADEPLLALVPAARRRPPAETTSEIAAGTRSSAPPSGPGREPQRPRAAPVHPEHEGTAADRGGAAADHPGCGRGGRDRARHWTNTWRRWPRTGAECSAATPSWTSRTRWSGSAVSVCAPTSRCGGQQPGRRGVPAAQAGPRSVLAPYVHGESAWHAHQGQRVVEYQQALQTVSDPLLGWTTVDGRSTTSGSSGT